MRSQKREILERAVHVTSEPMHVRPYFFFSFFCVPVLCGAQQWAAKCAGLVNERVTDVKVGPGDMLFSTGEFGPGSTVAGQPVVSQGLSDVFVMKQTAGGAVLWVVEAGGAGLDLSGKVCAAPDGSVLVCGQFSGTADLFGTSVTAQGGSTDFFVAKLAGTNGALLWVRTGGSAAYTDRASGVAVSTDGRVLVTGEFRGTGVFDAGTFNSTIDPNTSQPGSDVFVISYTSNGTSEWLRQGIAVRDDQAVDVDVDANGAAYVYGLYSEEISFGTPHPNLALNQIFLVKFDAGGNEQWFRRIGGAALQQPVDLQSGTSGGLLLCGDLQGTLTFYDNAPNTLPSAEPNAYFLVRCSTDGEFENGTAVGSVNAVRAAGLCQRDGTAAVYGEFECGFSDLQAHYNASGIFIATGEEDLFIAKHDDQILSLTEAQQFGGHLTKEAGAVTALGNDELVFCGSFSELLIFPSEGDGWGEDLGACAPVATGSNNYCGDAHYREYEAIESIGGQDGFLARGYVDSREPYDPYVRTGGGCDRSALDLIVLPADDTTDNFVACTSAVLGWVRSIHRPAYPNSGCDPSRTVSWNVDALWSTGGTFWDSIIVTQSGWYWRTHTSSNGCYSATDSIYVTILPGPHAWVSVNGGSAMSGPGPNAYSDCAAVPMLAMDLLPGETFQWYVDGVPVPGNPIMAEASGTYTLVVTSPNGCVATNPIAFTLLQALEIPDITSADFAFYLNGIALDQQDTVPVCDGVSQQGYILPTWYVDGVPTVLGQPYIVFSQTEGSGGLSSYADLPLHWFLDADTTGWYHMHVHMVMNVEGCTTDSAVFDAYDSVYFETGNTPVIQPLEDLSICIGDTAMVVLDCTGCTEVEWSGPNGTWITSTAEDTAWVWGFGLYTVVASNTVGVLCGATEYFTISLAQPPPLLIDPLAICPGDSAILSTTFPSVTYIWSGPSGVLPADNDSLFISEVGSYYLTTYTDLGCELFSGPAILQQYATPNLETLPDNVLCPGQSAALVLSGGGLDQIIWDPPLSGGNLTQSVSDAGTYTCTVTACGDTFALSVEIFASTIAVEIPPGPYTICGGGSVLLDGPAGDYDYLWTPGDLATEDLLATSPGDYQLQITDTLGCSALSNVAVVNEQQFTDPLQAEGDSLCAGESVLLIATGSGALEWYGDEDLAQSLGSGDTLVLGPQVVTDTLFIIQTEDGCTGPTLSVIVTVTPIPAAVTISGDTALCEGETLALSAAAQGAAVFNWNTPQGNTAGAAYTLTNVTATAAGDYTCYAENVGCTGPSSVVGVNIQDNIATPVITGGTTLCEGDVIGLVVSGVDLNGFLWQTPAGDLPGSSLTLTLPATVAAAGTYGVLAEGGECPDAEVSVEVTIELCGVIIPNVFTPNGDGQNDLFVVEGGASTAFEFHVFNRWGQEVYFTGSPRVAWNGRDNGNNTLPDGVYYYELHEIRSGTDAVHTGYIELTRGR